MANYTREERARREADKANNVDGNALTVDQGNPREPITPVRDDAPKPATPAATALPTGTPGLPEPTEYVDPVQAAEMRAEADARIPMARVRYKRGYFKQAGGWKIAAGTEEDLPIADARYLIESGIAEHVAHLPEG